MDLNKNPRGKYLFGLLFKVHTQMLQHKAAVKKEAACKKIILKTGTNIISKSSTVQLKNQRINHFQTKLKKIK